MVDHIARWYVEIIETNITKSFYNNTKITINDLEDLCKSLRNFFPESSYISQKLEVDEFQEKNWFKVILNSNHLSSYYQLHEISKSIIFLKTNSVSEYYPLFNKKGNLILSKFRSTLFEIYVARLFFDIGLNLDFGYEYLNSDGHSKEVDVCFQLDKRSYLVECTRLESWRFEVLTNIGYELTMLIGKWARKHNVDSASLLFGYIGLNEVKFLLKDCNQAKEEFIKLLRTYFIGMKPTENDLLDIPEVKHFSNYEILIEPHYFTKSAEERESKTKGFPVALIFELFLDRVVYGNLISSFKLLQQYNSVDQLLRKKIRDKIKQHKDSELEKLIFIEVENNALFNRSSKSFPITPEYLSKLNLADVLKNDIVVVILLKTIGVSEIRYYKFIYSLKDKSSLIMRTLDFINPKFSST